jgi:mannose-6-phosphate isomerase-like protein (cupin superfamily)
VREVRKFSDAKRFVTKDGSSIREIVSPRNSPLKKQSLAEATVAPGKTTKRHKHKQSEETYFILRGRGKIFLRDKAVKVTKGTAIAILAGTPHRIENMGRVPLVFLCHCSPAYAHSDTVILPEV